MHQRVIIASTNPVKIEATRIGFQRMYPDGDFRFEGIETVSGVSDQPMTRAETLQGATNRANHVAQLVPSADFAVGIEGGIQPDAEGRLEVFAWVVVVSNGKIGRAQTGIVNVN